MAPKTKRGRSTYDSSRFVSAKAQDRFNDSMSRKLIPERGFNNPGEPVDGVIASRGWQIFCTFTKLVVMSVVREFYANFPEKEGDRVYVRGIGVPFSAEVINDYLHLPSETRCTYLNYSPTENDLDEYIGFLTANRGLWKITNNKRVNFSTSKLTPESKAWHNFISARLLPTGHLSEVTRERAILNYYIQNGSDLNVGSIIFDTISQTARASTTAGLGCGAIIYALCERCGVKTESWEEVLQPLRPMTNLNLKTYEEHSVHGWMGGSRRAPMTVGSSSRASTSRASSSRGFTSDDMDDLTGRLDDLHYDMRELKNKVQNVEHHLTHFENIQYQHSDYEEQRDHAMFSYLRGEKEVTIPPYPKYPRYQPYDFETYDDTTDPESDS